MVAADDVGEGLEGLLEGRPSGRELPPIEERLGKHMVGVRKVERRLSVELLEKDDRLRARASARFRSMTECRLWARPMRQEARHRVLAAARVQFDQRLLVELARLGVPRTQGEDLSQLGQERDVFLARMAVDRLVDRARPAGVSFGPRPGRPVHRGAGPGSGAAVATSTLSVAPLASSPSSTARKWRSAPSRSSAGEQGEPETGPDIQHLGTLVAELLAEDGQGGPAMAEDLVELVLHLGEQRLPPQGAAHVEGRPRDPPRAGRRAPPGVPRSPRPSARRGSGTARPGSGGRPRIETGSDRTRDARRGAAPSGRSAPPPGGAGGRRPPAWRYTSRRSSGSSGKPRFDPVEGRDQHLPEVHRRSREVGAPHEVAAQELEDGLRAAGLPGSHARPDAS